MKRAEANGPGASVTIQVTDYGGWLSVHPEFERTADDYVGDLPLVLAKSLHDWLKQYPDRKIQFAVPINRRGRTYQIYAWYETKSERPSAITGVEFHDHQLTDADLKALERELERHHAKLDSDIETWVSPQQVTYHRLSKCWVAVPPDREAEIEELCSAHGFRRKERNS